MSYSLYNLIHHDELTGLYHHLFLALNHRLAIVALVQDYLFSSTIHVKPMSTPTIIYIESFPIRLGQFLKIANLVQDGFEAKVRIQYGEVELNGEVETRRGKQLTIDDLITFQGKTYQLSQA